MVFGERDASDVKYHRLVLELMRDVSKFYCTTSELIFYIKFNCLVILCSIINILKTVSNIEGGHYAGDWKTLAAIEETGVQTSNSSARMAAARVRLYHRSRIER